MKFDKCNSCEESYQCWHNGACQRFESTFLPSKHRKKVCHELCLGECVDPTSSGCYTCMDIVEDSKCVEKCSESKWKFEKFHTLKILKINRFRLLHLDSRRCIDEAECIRQNRKIFLDQCVLNCPSGYSTQVGITENDKTNNSSVCQKCAEKCPKFCAPPEIRKNLNSDWNKELKTFTTAQVAFRSWKTLASVVQSLMVTWRSTSSMTSAIWQLNFKRILATLKKFGAHSKFTGLGLKMFSCRK